MYGVEALASLIRLANSDEPVDRALFMRIYRDLNLWRGADMPKDWRGAHASCLARATIDEREAYQGLLQDTDLTEFDDFLRKGPVNLVVLRLGDPKLRLKVKEYQIIADRARVLSDQADPRLMRALLACNPVRLPAAVFLFEATPEQRLAILLAAQRFALLAGRQNATRPLEQENAQRLELAAIAGTHSEFIDALAQELDVERLWAARICDDPGGEPLVVALAALGATEEVTIRILAARDMSEGQTYPRLRALARLQAGLSQQAASLALAAFAKPAGAAQATSYPSSPRRDWPLRKQASARKPAVSPGSSILWAQGSRNP